MEQKYFKRRCIDVLRIMLTSIPLLLGQYSFNSHLSEGEYIFTLIYSIIGLFLLILIILHTLFRIINDAINAH